MQEIQFIETARTQRKFGVSVDYNTAEIANFCGCHISFPTFPGKEKHGDTKARIPTADGYVLVAAGDWIGKNSAGDLYVRKGA